MPLEDHKRAKTWKEREEGKWENTKVMQVPSEACLRAGMT